MEECDRRIPPDALPLQLNDDLEGEAELKPAGADEQTESS